MIQLIVLWLFLISRSIAQNCQQTGCAPGFCCSKLGFCGNTPLHCQGNQTNNNQNGTVCNPPCRAGFCCSKWGFCGDTPLHCSNKVSTVIPPASTNTTRPLISTTTTRPLISTATTRPLISTTTTRPLISTTTTRPLISTTTTRPLISTTTTRPLISTTTTRPLISTTTTRPLISTTTTRPLISTTTTRPLISTTTTRPLISTTTTRPSMSTTSTNPPSSQETTMTRQRFDCIFNQINSSLRDKRWQGYQNALAMIPFHPQNQDELMMFFAHVSHETDGLRTYEEYCGKSGACADNYQGSWCSPVKAESGKKYYGRGWFQLSWPCNYNAAGRALGVDFLKNPEKVAESDTFAAATAIWFWNTNNMGQPARNGNFGETTKKINSIECGAKPQQTNRIERYQLVRQCFGLSRATTNLRC